MPPTCFCIGHIAPRYASVLGIFRETGLTAVHTRAAIARLRLYRKIPELKTMLRQFYIHPDAVNTTRCGNTWMKKTARLYKQVENVQLENVTDVIKQKTTRYCEHQYTSVYIIGLEIMFKQLPKLVGKLLRIQVLHSLVAFQSALHKNATFFNLWRCRKFTTIGYIPGSNHPFYLVHFLHLYCAPLTRHSK